MASHTDILARLNGVLPPDREVRIADLRTLFTQDPEAVYQVALSELPESSPMAARGLQRLARTLSVLMRDGFAVQSAANQNYARGRQGGILPLDDGQPDLEFVQRLYTGSDYSSKMESQKRSRECLDFFLEDHAWDAGIRGTRLLRVAPEDTYAILAGSPRYQYESLLDSAREVVRCPSVVYKGLRHDGPMKTEGFAFCGIPSRRHMNNGKPKVPPNGFTFAVFANHDGYVFDWDWIPAVSKESPLPRNPDERFPHGKQVSGVHGELLVGSLRLREPEKFRPKQAWFSREGDCVFWYHSDAESYADRYDEYLTAFFDASNLDPHRQEKDACVGFKLKMVSQLVETVKRWAKPDTNEGIIVQFDQDRVEVELAFLMRAWAEAALPGTQELLPGMRLMEKLGKAGVEALSEKTPITIPQRSRDERQSFQSA